MNYLSAFCFFAILLFSCSQEKEQEIETPLEIIKSDSKPFSGISNLEQTLLEQGLVNVQSLDESILVDLKYSTTDNFFGSDVYGNFDKAFLQASVAKDLVQVQVELKKRFPSYSLYIFDAARPLSIQKVLWFAMDSIRPSLRKAFVADPAEGSIHNFGCAVDLSIYDTKRDSLLDMGTNYDFFGDLAYPRKENEMLRAGLLTQEQVDNRQVLRDVMAAKGFMPITSEWWHFNRLSRSSAKKTYAIIE